ncbi:hypothetical protein A8990_112110 [Paenibacillus taihuensis]|uniref:Uncharacterized protein n=1 Tax=Paenibacillus taihuensis TaxID=1156355 RepID=A0A3D9S7R8_9BACL|nr:hypothetical protein [Paenibacillus taihuensis]REE85381.1 hypothetical protein A8990_112110 [Paenibacillus taihuensis]
MKSLLVFILLAAMMCWFMFSPIYKHVLIVRQAVLQQEVDYLLEVGANGDHGYINSQMLQEAKVRLAAFGLKPASITFEVSAGGGADATNAAAPLPRGTALSLKASYPIEGLFAIDQLIGITPPSDSMKLSASGMKMSEYVP